MKKSIFTRKTPPREDLEIENRGRAQDFEDMVSFYQGGRPKRENFECDPMWLTYWNNRTF